MFFQNFLSACGKPDTSRQVGAGVTITALIANSSNLQRNQNLRITQSDPSRRVSMFQIRAILQIQSILSKSAGDVKKTDFRSKIHI